MSKTWLVTGSSSGIGRALVEQLLQRGERVAATLRKIEALSDLKARYGEQLWLAALDVNDPVAIREVMQQAFSKLGRIDVVVSNAGYALFGAAEEVSDEQIGQQLQTNLIGSMQVIRACLPYLREQGGGRILQLSSEGGQLAYPTSVFITRANGPLKALWNPWLKRLRRSVSNSLWWSRARHAPTSARCWSARQ